MLQLHEDGRQADRSLLPVRVLGAGNCSSAITLCVLYIGQCVCCGLVAGTGRTWRRLATRTPDMGTSG